MKGVMMVYRSGRALRVLCGAPIWMACLFLAGPVWAEGAGDASRAGSAIRSFQFQEFEDPVEVLVPRQSRPASDDVRLDALAWFADGRILQHRGNFTGALAAYRRAVERDPTAAAVYRVLVPLAIELRRLDEATKWATRGAEVNPGDHQLVTQAVLLLDRLGDQPGAIRILNQAAKVAGADQHSAFYVNLMQNLALLHLSADPPNVQAAAAGFEVVFDALTNPEKYKLDLNTRANLQSNEAITFERLGQVFLEAKKNDLALAAFSKAAESKKGRAAGGLSFNIAQVYLQAGRLEDALDELQKYIDAERQSKGRAAYELLAEILAKMERTKELIPRLEMAAAKDSRNSLLQFFLADQYAAADRLDDAEALYTKTLESAAEVQGYLGLAGVYRRQNRVAELLEVLAKGYSEAGELKAFAAEFKAIAGDEKLLDGLLKSGEDLLAEVPPKLDYATGYVLANLAADAKKAEPAERLYRYLLTLRRERAALLYEELGGFFLEVRKYADAAKVYNEAAEDAGLNDMRAQFLHQLTFALELSGDTKGALEAIALAQALIPDNPLLLFREAWVYYHARKFDEALEKMEKLIAEFPTHGFPGKEIRKIIRNAQYSVSNIHVLKGDIRRGEEILETIYKEAPDDISVNNDLGYLYADQGKNLEQAESMIRKALAAEPENGAYLDSLGWVLYKRGKYEEALPYLEKAVKNSPGAGDETLWEHLGDVQERLKRPGPALEAWKKALEFSDKAAVPDKKLIERVKEKISRQAPVSSPK